jgi:hypothetical protein
VTGKSTAESGYNGVPDHRRITGASFIISGDMHRLERSELTKDAVSLDEVERVVF